MAQHFSMCRGASEVKLQSKLHQPRSTRLRDLAEGRVEAKRVRVQELGVVEGIEQLTSKLDRFSFANFGLLQERNVPVIYSGAAQTIPAYIAERCRITGRQMQIIVELAIERSWVKIEIAVVSRRSQAIRRSIGERMIGTRIKNLNLANEVGTIEEVAL